MQFRQRPILIEAVRWFKNGDHPDDACFRPYEDTGAIPEVPREGKVVRYFRHPAIIGREECPACHRIINDHGFIDTPEGGHIVCPGDWIVRGVRGNYWACKPEAFLAMYEPLVELQDDAGGAAADPDRADIPFRTLPADATQAQRVHNLKCWPEHFGPLVRGEKRCEVRIDDRGYRVGDQLKLHEFQPCRVCRGSGIAAERGAEPKTCTCGVPHGTYTGRVLTLRVTHLLGGGQFGLARGHVCMSVLRETYIAGNSERDLRHEIAEP